MTLRERFFPDGKVHEGTLDALSIAVSGGFAGGLVAGLYSGSLIGLSGLGIAALGMWAALLRLPSPRAAAAALEDDP